MKKIIQFIISMPFLAVMLFIYATSMGVATFIERDFGPEIARYFIYNAWWFEFIQLILAINFIGNIFKYKFYKKPKWSIFLFHLAFVFILLGAAITRYTGFEGSMHIRNGESGNKMMTDKNFIIIKHAPPKDSLILKKELFVSPYIKNNFKTDFNYAGKKYEFESVKLIQNAVRHLKNDSKGFPLLEMSISVGNAMQVYYLVDHSKIQVQGTSYGLNLTTADSCVQFTIEDSKLYVKCPEELFKITMKGEIDTSYAPNQKVEILPIKMYRIRNQKFRVSASSEKAVLEYVQSQVEQENNLTILSCLLKSDADEREIYLPVIPGELGEAVSARLNNNEFLISYGAAELELPFSLKLRSFVMERYPGSESPSSFKSRITLIDEKEKINRDDSIFMNNVLDYKGYRFFQSSYDRDEQGTTLSVNHDKPGTFISYFGYFLLALGMIWSLFSKNTHLTELKKKASEIRIKRKGVSTIILILILICSQYSYSQDSLKIDIDKKHADHFGTLLIQDNSGRIEPFNTKASEYIRKISGKEQINGYDHNQVVIGMMFNPAYWQTQPMIKVKHSEVKKILGTDQDLVSFDQFLDKNNGEYKLKDYIGKAFEKKPEERDKFTKEIIAVDERVNLSYQIYTGQFLNIIPMPGDVGHKWLMPSELKDIRDSNTRIFTLKVFRNYLNLLLDVKKSDRWQQMNLTVDSLLTFQKEQAGKILPSNLKRNLEIQYVNLDIFNRIYKFYGIIGFVFLIVLFVAILKPGLKINKISLILIILIGLIFLSHTLGLAIRWYISGHAPWSNGYESMIYISWATMLAGFLFMKRSQIVLAATALLSSITLMVAHLSWIDPQITNLVPVLKSYWLTIHVSVITASYGFLGLGALLGLLNLIMMIMRSSQNRKDMDLSIDELTIVNHMTLIIGLYLLTLGTFLGAVWANESWGKYWGWDPKETWALISVVVYSIILHTRLIPSLNNRYTFNLLSVLGFSSILMTYFGVNYILGGMHSYAQGDPSRIPNYVYVVLAVVALIAIGAHLKNTFLDAKEE